MAWRKKGEAKAVLEAKAEAPKVQNENVKIKELEEQLSELQKGVGQIKEQPKAEEAIKFQVVKELPREPVRYTTDETGEKVQLITIEEALQILLSRQ